MKTSKRKVTDDVPDVEEKRNDKYLKMEDNHEHRKTTDTASSLLKPELQDAPVQAARTFNFNSKLNQRGTWPSLEIFLQMKRTQAVLNCSQPMRT